MFTCLSLQTFVRSPQCIRDGLRNRGGYGHKQSPLVLWDKRGNRWWISKLINWCHGVTAQRTAVQHKMIRKPGGLISCGMVPKGKMYGPQSAYGSTLKRQAEGLVPTKEKCGAAWGIRAFRGLIASWTSGKIIVRNRPWHLWPVMPTTNPDLDKQSCHGPNL